MRQRRVFYFAPISTDAINARYGAKVLPGAASNKVLGICTALREVGVAAVAVSGVVPAGGRDIVRCVALHRVDAIAYARVWSLGRAATKRLTASLGFLVFTIRFVRENDRVLLYNFFPDTIPAAILLRLRGRPAILDIEDAPPPGEPGLRGVVNRLCFRVLRGLCASRCVTVSHHLGRQLGLARFLPVHGVARFSPGAATPARRFAAPRLTILFGGSVQQETGLALFTDALRLLARTEPDLPVRFVVTGHYPADALRALRAEIEGMSRIAVVLLSGLSAAEYRALLDDVAIGLSLKLPDSPMGRTTFPSKVIEYAAAGILVVATPVSDIPAIFADDAAIVLRGSDPAELASRLAAAARDRPGSIAIAERGRRAVSDAMSPVRVGRALAAFLFEEAG